MAIKLLIGGSPCTKWSIAQTKDRETQPNSGIGWDLFENYLIAKAKFKPDFFLYENNKSAAQAIKDEIAKELGVGVNPDVRFTHINSALVSAQNRQRFYVTDFGDIEQPEDRGILLKDILETGNDLTRNDKSFTLTTRCSGAIPEDTLRRRRHTMICEPVGYATPCEWDENGKPTKAISMADSKPHIVYEVKDGQITIKGKQYPIKLPDGYYIIRKLTVRECARLQTMPDDYCKAVSDSQAYKALGNGWTAEVIIHLLNHALKDVPKDEEIVVLSLSMTELQQVGIALIRWDLQMLPITHTRLTNIPFKWLWITIPISSNTAMLSQFVRTIGSRRRLAPNGWTSC